MTTAQQIITQALALSLANDQGNTLLGQDTAELTAVLSRVVRQIYTEAALPPSGGGTDRGHGMFVTRGTVTMGTPASTAVSFPSTPAEVARLLTISDAGGMYVYQTTQADLDLGIAEIPPAVVLGDRQLYSANRTGDPTAGAVLTITYQYLPAVMTAATQTIGAMDTGSPSTSQWPSAAGDPFLVHWLGRYLAVKDGNRDRAEIDMLTASLKRDAATLGAVVGVAAGRLAAIQVDA